MATKKKAKKTTKSTKKKTAAANERTVMVKLTGIPNSRVDEVVKTMKSSPKYVDHVVVAEDDKHSTIIATFKK